MSTTYINDSCVDGAFLAGKASALNPAPGSYDFSSIDPAITTIRAAGKRYSLAISFGINVPGWWFTSGGVASVNTSAGVVPLPWDVQYETLAGQLIQALGDRYGNDLALASIKYTGLNWKTGETHIIGATTVDNPAWLQAGYAPSLIEGVGGIEGAFQTFEGYFNFNFPNVEQLAGILPDGGWPLTDITNDTTLNSTLASIAPTNWYWQFDGLGPNGLPSAAYGMKGYQEVQPLTGDVITQLNAELAEVLSQPTAEFIEIYNPSVIDSVICPARATLLTR